MKFIFDGLNDINMPENLQFVQLKVEEENRTLRQNSFPLMCKKGSIKSAYLEEPTKL